MSENSPRQGLISVEQLRIEVDAGTIDTVLIVLPDMQGRLQGKRLTGRSSLTRSSSTTLRDATTCSQSTSR